MVTLRLPITGKDLGTLLGNIDYTAREWGSAMVPSILGIEINVDAFRA